ncbi:hypothetical protein NPIL_665421 [Nephila pilipes]|uniref:Uncharacterized protein n=1 Tax=Nephila pilipes TaxID=299642 RepID=A0A8X6NJJ5_NEPPI|nr:hypothetical protein NPIL_665421 [Nephila pilipes]
MLSNKTTRTPASLSSIKPSLFCNCLDRTTSPSSCGSEFSLDSNHPQAQGYDTENKPFGTDSLQPFTQMGLNDLTRDLGLSKEAAELLGSRLKENKIIGQKVLLALFYWYRSREKEFIKSFEEVENLAYCSDVP